MANINNLYKAFLNGECTPEMLDELMCYFNTNDLKEIEVLIDEELNQSTHSIQSNDFSDMINNNLVVIHEKINPQTSFINRKIHFLRWASAVAAIFIVCIGAYFFLHQDVQSTNNEKQQSDVHDLDPGSNTAFLMLDNGEKIKLKDDASGLIIDNGAASYSNGEDLLSLEKVTNMVLYTPRGGEYKVILPDGSKVWLNADSKIEYPSKFSDKERIVKLTGEAYFEVVKNKKAPFIVHTSSQKLQVLGTTFNINAYSSSQTATTLVEGKVNLYNNSSSEEITLNPNQHAVVGNEMRLTNVDPTIYTAWKEGYFKFKAASMVNVLEQLERWYDLEIDYSAVPKNIKVHATIKKDKKLKSVLYALEEVTSLKFKLTGRRLDIIN